MARALFFQSKVPVQFWGECVLAATFLVNRLPSPSLQYMSPYERLFQKKPDYHAFRVFSCLCYASTLLSQRTKFTLRAISAVFLGYPVGYKGYKLYDLEQKRFFISRDITFVEDVFPFHTSTIGCSQVDEFPEVVLPCSVNDSTPSAIPLRHLPAISAENSAIDNDHPPAAPIACRRSIRVHRPPSYLQDYQCHQVAATHPISNFDSLGRLSDSYKSLVCQVSSTPEPIFFHQAVAFPEWRKAMDEELKAMEDNNTWSLVPLPQGKHTIGCRWVYKIKYRQDGSVDRYKACLVAKGYTQQARIDFLDTFSPVAKFTTIHVLLAIAAIKG